MENNRVPVTGDSTREPHETGPYPEGSEHPSESATQSAAADDEAQLYPESRDGAPVAVEAPPQAGTGGGGGKPPGGDGGGDDGGGGDEEEMAKMSFLEHLEELRKRIIRSLIAVALAFGVCFAFAEKIFSYASAPVRRVLRELGMSDKFYFLNLTDSFTIYLNLALVVGLFVASPLVLYQVWAFIAPGLYKKERRYAVPFVFFCSSLFICGGLFAYLIAFPFAAKFLLTYGGEPLVPMLTADKYIDLFYTVILGLGLVFELPVLMMFLGLIGIVTPGFLLRNFRYAILLIFIVAAVVTPTPDVMNMMIFAIPMVALFVLGVGLVWAVQRKRKSRWVW